jgi:DNA-binding NarL/FixJ family response regulator
VKKFRLLLVDDQAMFREGLRLILSQHADFEIVGEAGDGLAALECINRVLPDVILMDLRMPKLGGVETTARIRREWPNLRVIVLTTFEEDAEIFAAIRAGAAGFLLKDAPSEKLSEAIRLAMRGETWLQPSVASRLVAEFGRLESRQPSPRPDPLLEPLSPREKDVLRWLGQGLSNKEIGSKLGISEGTVKNHLSQILGKLQVLDRTQAALKARELGLV